MERAGKPRHRSQNPMGRVRAREAIESGLSKFKRNPDCLIARRRHRLQQESPRRLVIIAVTMPMPMPVTIPLLVLISVFIAIVAPMMLPPLHFPLSVFEFSAHPHSAFISPRRRFQVRYVLARQPERLERPDVELTGRRNSRARLERTHRERRAMPVSAVNPASIISATPQLTLHFRDDLDVHLTQRRVVYPANKSSACLNPPPVFP